MKPYYSHAGITIYHGDCRDVLPKLEAQSERAVAWAEAHTKEALVARAERDKEALKEWLS